ncbi:hypothetical protein Tco_0328238 [Tanacetum coccineum]
MTESQDSSCLMKICEIEQGQMEHASQDSSVFEELSDGAMKRKGTMARAEKRFTIWKSNSNHITSRLHSAKINWHIIITHPKPRSRYTSLVALGQSTIKLAHKRSFANVRRQASRISNCPPSYVLRVDPLLTKLEFPQELSKVHNTFHVILLEKCYDPRTHQPSVGWELHLDDKLHFVEEPLDIVGREVKQLKRSRISLVKVRWNSKRGPEFTWEREDQFKKKYPHLFTKTTPSSSAAS